MGPIDLVRHRDRLKGHHTVVLQPVGAGPEIAAKKMVPTASIISMDTTLSNVPFSSR
ncbi:MAG: hypothetical protein MZV70_59765 [Desulfobacterales bacterium]|nr:hypothetical protein [Desulfobacterales bacterium]